MAFLDASKVTNPTKLHHETLRADGDVMGVDRFSKELLSFLDLCKQNEQLFMDRTIIMFYEYSHGRHRWTSEG